MTCVKLYNIKQRYDMQEKTGRNEPSIWPLDMGHGGHQIVRFCHRQNLVTGHLVISQTQLKATCQQTNTAIYNHYFR